MLHYMRMTFFAGLLLLPQAAISDPIFGPRTDYSAGAYPDKLAAGDIDGDGDVDLAVTDPVLHQITLLRNDGNGVFTFYDTLSLLGYYPSRAVITDLDSDGDNDLAVGDGGTVRIYENRGGGSLLFSDIVPLGGGRLMDLCAADFNNDDDIDLAAALTNGGDTLVQVFQDNDGSLIERYRKPADMYTRDLATGRFDNNISVDIATAYGGNMDGQVLLHLNNGLGYVTATHTLDLPSAPYFSVFAADFDNDDDLDLAASRYWSNVAYIALNDGDGIMTRHPYSLLCSQDPRMITGADFDRDDDIDIIAACDDSTMNYFDNIYNLGYPQFFSSRDCYPAGAIPIDIVVADFNGDTKPDAATANILDSSVSIFLNIFVIPGDANGDGGADVADAVSLVNFIFRGGPPPVSNEEGDANCDGVVNLADAVYLINYVFKGGPEPGCP